MFLRVTVYPSFFRNSTRSLLAESFKHRRILYYYLVPAFLYCFYNNLAFTNLAIFDPTSYFMFMQTRLLMTGVIYQFLFKKKLSCKQWISLLVLTIGCMLQKLNLNFFSNEHEGESQPELVVYDTLDTSVLNSGLFLIMLQVKILISDNGSLLG